MKSIFKNNKLLLAIVFLALAVRVMYFLYAKPWEESFISEKFEVDAKEYHMLAEKTIEDGKYPENFFLDTFRTPVFPCFIVLFYSIFGIKPYIIFIASIFLNLVSIIYIYLICQKIFDNKKISLIASALYALEPNVIKSVTEFLPDTLYSTLLIISVYYFIVGIKERKYSIVVVSSIFFGITTLTRPVNLYFYILCILFIFLYPGDKFLHKLKYAVLFISVYFMSLAPWMYRNYSIYNYFSTSAYQGNAAMYYAGMTKSVVENINLFDAFIEIDNSVKKACEENMITNPFEVDKQKQKIGLDYIIQHIDVYIPFHIKGMFNFFVAPLNNEKYLFKSRIIFGLYLFFIYSLFIVGIYGSIKEKKYLYTISLTIIVFYFSFLTGVVGLARYRLPSTAFYIIISAFGFYYFINRVKERFEKNK